jgi:small subunit ribosomal protein S17
MDTKREINRKIKEGIVVSNKMAKTVTVRVDRKMKHTHFEKVMTRSKRYYAHTEQVIENGQRVKIMETRPLSKLKKWKVIEVVTD